MVTVDVSGLIREVEEYARRVRDDAAERVLEACKADCPVSEDNPLRTTPPGALRDSLEIVDTTDTTPLFGFVISSDLEYSAFTDEVDTNPHPIIAAPGRTLRFWWEAGPQGAGVYNYRSVWHPGTVGQKWFASKNEQRYQDALDEVVG